MVTPPFPWAACSNTANPFGEDIFPNIQSKPPLTQLQAVSSCPVASYLVEETDIHLATTSFQVAVEINKVSPQSPLLQAKQSQFRQPLLVSQDRRKNNYQRRKQLIENRKLLRLILLYKIIVSYCLQRIGMSILDQWLHSNSS